MTAAEELEIIDRVRGGDRSAFEALVLDNQKKVYNLALKMTGNENDALDIAQESFIKAYTGLKSFRGDSRFSVWLYRLVYNLCIDFSRKKQRTDTTSLTYVNDDGEYADMEVPDLRYAPEVASEKRELRAAVSKGIQALPPKHREILVMREVTGMSYEDIAITLNISEGTVKSRLSRARMNLAALLSQYGTFYGNSRHKDSKEVEERG
ncbi:RNA polymerase sigma-70 factor, ECF subfamily [Sporobacter termitidis DSM 10068]|uniref:RNA polymerase sigma-70 factor, ECF subfamily n=1 Tax=Sporobacter termitidis DSM 10068 TaxID=1123282 RepID=A0A1M5VB59_9FIRM|nr:sigma-70 family RNA polymerase sigma factor [Sporobacter termitidis]SHH72479.1 RNA polymerase sigma-70 factor, ECF subfamily [Sporobacter termitidis DSM 10068]